MYLRGVGHLGRRRGVGQYSADTGLDTPLDTSAVQIVAPTFVGPCPVAGQLMNPQTGVCLTASTPTPYVDPSIAAASGNSVTTPSFPSWLIPVAAGAFILLAFLGAKR
jgi:hypothetical protein